MNNRNYVGSMNHGLSGERLKLNQHGSQEKLSNYSGNYGSPTMDTRGNSENYIYNGSQGYLDQI